MQRMIVRMFVALAASLALVGTAQAQQQQQQPGMPEEQELQRERQEMQRIQEMQQQQRQEMEKLGMQPGQQQQQQQQMGADVQVTESQQNFAQTLRDLRRGLREANLDVIDTIRLRAQAQEGEQQGAQRAQILVFNDESVAQKVMQEQPEHLAAMPSKLVVWEDAQNDVSVAYQDPQQFARYSEQEDQGLTQLESIVQDATQGEQQAKPEGEQEQQRQQEEQRQQEQEEQREQEEDILVE